MSSTPETSQYVCKTAEETCALGYKIGKACSKGSIISLRGPLGAGKTVITKGIAQALEISEAIVSPTFTLVQEYEGTQILHHLDLYRIEGIEDFAGIGGEELLYGDGITVIEWSEKIDEILPLHTIYLSMEILNDQSRLITLKGLRV
jgi:tRNA threonylcarbamoyladenosine biosynthesis protein TsaE